MVRSVSYGILTGANSILSAVLADDETADVEYARPRHPIAVGAARQMFGSGSLRTGAVARQATTRRKAKTTPRPAHHDYAEYDDEDDDDGYEHGIIHPVAPPLDPSFRVIGGVRVPGIDTDLYGARKSGGERQDVDGWHAWDRPDGMGPHRTAIMSPEHDLRHGNGHAQHMSDGDDSDATKTDLPCTLGCLNSEFLCTRSCMCIPKHQRCDQEANCSPYGEDEEQCTQSNHEILRDLKKECEASDHHVMCPKTYVCIAKEFLCDGNFVFMISISVERGK